MKYAFLNPMEDDDTLEYSSVAQSGHLRTQRESDVSQFVCVKLFTKIDTFFSDLM